MPKVELHAHLTGSIRIKTIFELLDNEEDKENLSKFYNSKIDLTACFNVFDYIYKILKSIDVIKRITREMMEDWSKANCVYLEIRTNIKAIGDKTKYDYAITVLKEIKAFNEDSQLNLNGMQTRLILSFNRRLPISEAKDTLQVYRLLSENEPELSKLIVGVDYSGYEVNESIKFDEILEVLIESKKLGLKSAVHIAEIPNYTKWDFERFRPDRMGHTDYFTEEDSQQLIDLGIPYECCPSSSYYRLNCISYKEVNFKKYYKKLDKNGNEYKHYSINTDDTSLFNSDLSQEYYEIASAFEISEKEIREIAARVADDIFDDNYKEILKEKMKRF